MGLNYPARAGSSSFVLVSDKNGKGNPELGFIMLVPQQGWGRVIIPFKLPSYGSHPEGPHPAEQSPSTVLYSPLSHPSLPPGRVLVHSGRVAIMETFAASVALMNGKCI